MLEQFLSLLPEIRIFLDTKEKPEPELDHTAGLSADITCHLKTLNLQLQGRDKLLSNMLNAIRAFQNKITALYIPNKEFIHFPKLSAAALQPKRICQCFGRAEGGNLNPDSMI